MAGSLNHIIGKDGKFTMDYIENLRDAYEALEECFELIRVMSGGRKKDINKYCDALRFPHVKSNMVKSELEGELE